MEPNVVAQHEHYPPEEGKVVPEQGWEYIPGRLLNLPEPDPQQGGVLQEGEGEVHQILVPRLLFLGVEEGEDVDCSENESKQKLFKVRVTSVRALEDDPRGHDEPVRSTKWP